MLAFYFASFLRTDLRISNTLNHNYFINSIFFTFITTLIGFTLGLYTRKYLLASLEEILALNTQIFIGSSFMLFIRFLQDGSENIPRSIPIIAALIYVFLALAIRVVIRYGNIKSINNSGSKRNVIIYGAGDLGSHIADLVLMDEKLNLIGYIDDDPKKQSLILRGKRVLSTIDSLPKMQEEFDLDQIIVAISKLSDDKMKFIQNICEGNRIKIRIIPSATQLISGLESLGDLINFNEKDILGRSQVSIDKDLVEKLLSGKRILITGAGGSIGSEIAKQCRTYSPASLFLLDRDETNLNNLELELFGCANSHENSIFLVDIRDSSALAEVFLQTKPDIVFHAAALKHLPILEKFPDEAYKTNVVGTLNVIDLCLLNGVQIFVNISTDKAADPISILGKTKFQAEKIVAEKAQELDDSKFKYLSVRFGNVIGSRGSVLHTFKYQIDNNLPVTITHPEVSRYFMTVQEAVSLVLQSAVLGENGETLILDMGEPVKILDVANFLIKQSGKNIPIKFTGLKPGEKLNEVLTGNSENVISNKHPSIYHTRVKY